MSQSTPESTADRPLPLVGYGCFTAAYLSLCFSLQLPWLWVIFFILFLFAHRLNWHPLSTTPRKIIVISFLAGVTVILDTVITAEMQIHAVNSPFLTRRATYLLGYSASLLSIYFAFTPRDFNAHRNLAVISAAMLMMAGNIAGQHPYIHYYNPTLFTFGAIFLLWLEKLSHFRFPVFQSKKTKSKRKSRWNVALIILTLVMTYFGMRTVYSIQKRYGNKLFQWMRQESSLGIWDQTRIGRFRKIILSRKVILWYQNDGQGGIHNLVGKRFQAYEKGGAWIAKPLRPKRIDPWDGSAPPALKKELDQFTSKQSSTYKTFNFNSSEDQVGALPSPQRPHIKPLRHDRVLLVRQLTGTLYLPLRSRALAIKFPNLYLSQTGTASLSGSVTAQEYSVLAGNEFRGRGWPSHLNSQFRKMLTTVPPSLREKFQKLALEITKGAKSPEDQAAKIEAWFHRNFKYKLEFIPDNKYSDPIDDFLTNRKAAWCEFFASGMCLLLRSLDVPTRYVGGYVAHDYDKSSKTYTVRSADAHAWVEVYFEKNGWTSFDPTPAAGRQQHAAHSKANLFERFTAAVWKFILEFLIRAARFSFKDFVAWCLAQLGGFVFWFFNSPLKAVLSLLSLGLFGYSLFKKRRSLRLSKIVKKQAFTASSFDGTDQAFAELLMAFDAALTKYGWDRPAHLTPYEIARRLENKKPEKMNDATVKKFALFARSYGTLRFSSNLPDDEELQALKDSLP
jgi:hypothetical protein